MNLREKTLEMQKRILGDEHPDTLWSRNNLVKSYYYLGQHKKARQLGKQAVEAQQRILGPDHLDTLSSARLVTRISSK